MFYITHLIYVIPGEEVTFAAFEERVLPLLERYQGRLLYRIRPERSEFIRPGQEELPYEIHLISFPDRAGYQGYQRDQERLAYMPLFRKSVKRQLLIEGCESGQ